MSVDPTVSQPSVALAQGWPRGLPFEALFEHAPVAAFVTRQDDGIVSVNAAWETLSGMPRDAMTGRTPVAAGLWNAAMQQRIERAGGVPGQGVRCDLRLQGKLIPVRVCVASVDDSTEPLRLWHVLDATPEWHAEVERARAEAALQDAQRNLQQRAELHEAIEMLAHVGHWIQAPGDEEVAWSRGLFEICGWSVQPTVSSTTGRSGIHAEDYPAWLAAREAADGRVVDFRWMRADGQQRWLRTRIGRTSVKGNPQTDFGVVQDITAEREAVLAQAEQLRLLQSITARVPGVVFQSRMPVQGWGSFSYVSEVVRDMFGLAPQTLYEDAKVLFSRVHPDDQAALRQSIFHCTRTLTPWRLVFRVALPGQGMRWYGAEGLPKAEPDGSVLWHGFVHDVTESRQAAQALDRQHRMLEAVRQAQAAFIEADDKRQAFERLLQAFLSVTRSAYGFVGEVLYDLQDQPYLKTHAITNVAWDDSSSRMYDEQRDAGMEFHNLKTLFGHALVSRETVIANEPASDQRGGGLPAGHPGMSAFLGVPLSLGDRLIAMVGLANAPGGYSQDDVEFLQPLFGAVQQLVMAWRGHAERQRSRQQLQATSALLADKSAALQVTLDSISQGLAKMDPDGRITIYNRRLLELLGLTDALLARYPTQQAIGRYQAERGDFGSGFELVEPAAREAVSRLSELSPDRYWRRTTDGRTLEIRTRMLPDGGMVRTYTDVTSYIEAEAALREQRQRLEWVLEATGPGIWELDLATQGAVYSERWAALLGHGLNDLLPANRDVWRSRVHPDDLGRAEAALEAHWRGETPVYDCDLRMRHRQGAWLWFNDRGRVHRRDADGRPLYMSGTLLDIHERVTAQEEVRALNASLERRVAERTAELERSMRDMEVISYSIAHDLRAPLRSVNGFASLVSELDGQHLSPEGREMFLRIVSASRNMGQMITDMLELLRVVRVEIEPESVDMAALAHSVVEALAPAVPNAEITIGHLPRVLGDAKLLRQMLSNLVDNALKYSRHREPPRLELGFDRAQRAFYLRDNGMGFDMAHASKLFGLFQRLHAGVNAPGGTGVGLAIVARTLERHGGRVWAEARPGDGATFWWTLPLG